MFRKLVVVGALVLLAACSRDAQERPFTQSSVLGTELARQAATDCSGYPSQAAAQAALRANPSDPNNLDPDDDGIACENNPGPYDRTPVNRPGTGGAVTTTTLPVFVTTTLVPPTTVAAAPDVMANSGPRDAVGLISLAGVVLFTIGFALRGKRSTGVHWLD